MTEPMHVETDVLVIGAGGAGMYAAIEAARNGASVLLADRSLIGRGGATMMAQMTVAVALGAATPDSLDASSRRHAQGRPRPRRRGRSSRLLCEEGPECIREMDGYGASLGAPRRHLQPGHGARASTGRAASTSTCSHRPAVSKTLRTAVNATRGIRNVGRSPRTSMLTNSRRTASASRARSRLHLASGAPVTHRGQGDDRRDRRPDASLPAQQRVGQHERRRIRCSRATPARR